MSPVKILFFPGLFTSGGVETVVMNIFRNIDKKKFHIDFCVPRDYEGQFDNEVKGYGSNVIEIPQIRHVGIISYIRAVKRIIKENGPYQAVHVHSIHNGVYTIIASYLAGIKKRIYHVHNTDDPSIKNIPVPKIYRLIIKSLIKIMSTDYVACGEEAADYIYGKKNKNVVIINNALDLSAFKAHPKIYAERFKEYLKADIIIGNAARFTSVKNQSFLIKLLYEYSKKRDNVVLLLAGDGSTRQKCEEYVKELGLENSVKFLGNINDMPDFYNKLDLFILPSLHEGLPVTIIEAQACGIPCVISDTITKECDLGLNLVKSLSLDDSLENWINLVNNMSIKKEYDNTKISKAITDKGYNVDDMIKKITSVYLK